MPGQTRSSSPSESASTWWQRAVFYQVYPLSFSDDNGDGMGDLPGLLDRLPYIADLGVDAIWLSPVFTSPLKDFGYDISDYRAIDPRFGTLDDFDAVVARAHALGLRLIVDQVWSHSSDQHAWFVEGAASRDNDRSDWYVWADAKADGTPPNNWQASFGGPAWTWHPCRRQYYFHNFLASQPDLNIHCAAVQDALLDTARFWLDRGVDGFRLDVINYLAHDPALTDNPAVPHARVPAATIRFQRQRHNKSQPAALAFVARLRKLLDSYPGTMAVGEIFDDDMVGRQIEYTDGPDRLHTAYSFALLHARAATPALFRDALEPWTGARGWPSWSLGNHDVPRFPSRFASDGVADDRQTRMLLALLLSLRGTPFLFQGDELGLPQARVPFERLRDPFAIAAWTASGDAYRDGARTPMPWSDDPGAGFSQAADPWLPVDPAHLPLAVSCQAGDPHSMLTFTRHLLSLRRTLPALMSGSLTFLPASAGLLGFTRVNDGQTIECWFDLAGDETLPSAGGEVLAQGSGGFSWHWLISDHHVRA